MKKVIIGILCVVVVVVGAVFAFNANKPKETETKNEVKSSNVNSVEAKESEQEEEGYEIIVSKKELTIEKGKTESFEITFTNPDEMSIREYIHCEDQSEIVIVRYSDTRDRKINVDVEGLKVGTTEIEICDFDYQNRKVFVKVNVVEATEPAK